MSEAPVEGGGAAREQRLHPWSWLFVLLQQLRQFIVPLLVLLFAGRRGASDGWVTLAPLLGVGVLVVVSILQYFTFRYRIGSDAITLRSGLLQRSWREIPFARIHNVGLHQSLLHRVFGVAEVRLESAGGDKPEAQLRVLGLQDALALERLVRHRGAAGGDAVTVHPAPADAAVLFPANALVVLSLRRAIGVRMRILEAWARGVPVVATSAAAAGLDPGAADALVVADGPDALADALAALARDADARARLVAAGRAFLCMHHDPPTVAAALGRVYADVAKSTRART